MINLWQICIALAVLATLPGNARACTEKDFSTVIERASQNLRRASARSQPVLEKKFLEIAKLKGWPSERAMERAYALVQDDKVKALDAEAAQLILRMDQLGEASAKDANCKQLEELKGVAARLQTVSTDKTRHVATKLALIIQDARAPAKAPARRAPVQHSDKAGKTKPTAPGNQSASAPNPARPSKWATTTKPTPWPTETVMSSLPKLDEDKADTFTADEIRAAGRGLFGSLSAELASIIEFTFRKYGRPNGYILGREGGAAFLAGLRYGSGQLVTKRHDGMRVYWQGPSVGYDFGLTGARVLILVYNLKDPDKLFTRFAGLEGAAYLVGGAGITFHKRGRLVLAPIRTGLGVRLGANVGYLKFSRTRDLNPF
jgi:hypothetical protein